MVEIPVKTDEHLRELIDYKDISFPLETWRDDYSTFPDYTLNCHWHDAFEFGTVITGSLDFYMDEVCVKLQKGDTIFINSNVLHMAKQTCAQEPVIMIGTGFPPSIFPEGCILEKYFEPVIKAPFQGFRLKSTDVRGKRFAEIIGELCQLQDETYGSELWSLSLLSQLWLETLACISEKSISLVRQEALPRHGAIVKQMISYIQEHFADPITIQDLTEYAHISRSECFRSFHRYTGKKPVEYINEYRLRQAAGLLKGTSLTVSEIGASCGFGSSSYFGKLFREKYKASPLEYRKGETESQVFQTSLPRIPHEE